jgi:hypothetical protein
VLVTIEGAGGLGRASLLPPVRRLLGEGTRLVEWRSEPLHGGTSPSSLRRVGGLADVGGRPVPFSFVVKQVSRGDEAERSWRYWRREPALYASGWLDDLPGVRAPRYYGVEEGEDGARVWLEEVVGGAAWSLERYARAARDLGLFNGAYLAGRPAPDRPWLSRGGLRAWCEARIGRMAPLATIGEHPELGRYWPAEVVEGTLRLIAERGRFFDALDRLPQTFCHGDAIAPNMVAADDGTVLLDWGFAGWGAVGQEAGQSALGSVGFWRFEADRLAELGEACFTGYVDGLRGAGWTGDARLARLGFCLDPALRYGAFPFGLAVPDETARERSRLATGHTFEENATLWTALRRYALGRAEEARGLMEALW